MADDNGGSGGFFGGLAQGLQKGKKKKSPKQKADDGKIKTNEAGDPETKAKDIVKRAYGKTRD